MAATKFSIVYTIDGKEGVQITNFETPMTYKIATIIATENAQPGTTVICVIETWKLYPNKNEKTEKKDKMDDTKQGL